jgi:hypothetical protein
VQGVIEYFEEAPKDYRNNLCSGLLCFAPICFKHIVPANLIESTYVDPVTPLNSQYKFARFNLSQDFPPNSDLRHLGLKADEFLLAMGYKFRTCIIASKEIPIPELGDTGFQLVPIYSLFDRGEYLKKQYTKQMVQEAMAYKIPELFYIPSNEEFGIQQSLASLVYMQFVPCKLIRPKPVKLTNEAINLLKQWIWHLFDCPILDPALEEYIKDAEKALNADKK